jgi:hypothetical protein
MTLATLMETCGRHGIEIRPAGGNVRVKAPKGILNPGLTEAIREHKPAILSMVPPGWPVDVPIPSWWPELAGAFPRGFLREAKRGECLDPDCRFPVAVLWWDETDRRFIWSCPACGLESGCRPIH